MPDADPEPQPTRYVIYVPVDERTTAMAECLEYVTREHPDWKSAGVIVGRWTAVVAMVERGLAEIILVAQRSHLPPDRIPRVVAVEEELTCRRPSLLGRLTQRRPRPLA
jgi:hypothetical protein